MKKNIKKLELTITGTRHNMPGETLDERQMLPWLFCHLSLWALDLSS